VHSELIVHTGQLPARATEGPSRASDGRRREARSQVRAVMVAR
jgi:hypothetical protein